MVVRKIQPNELKECEKIARVAFEGDADLSRSPEEHRAFVEEHPRSREQAYYQEKWAAYTDEGKMMACLSALPYQVHFDGSIQGMTGIAGVCTYPQYRRRGAVRSCMMAMLRDSYDKGVSFSYLHAFSEAFYGAFGYTPSSHSNQWLFTMEALYSIRPEGEFELYTAPRQIEGFAKAYERYAGRFNLTVRRDEHDWYFLKSADPYKGHRYAYLYRDQSGEPRGYLLFHKERWKDQPLMQVEELVFEDRDVLEVLLSFAKTFQANYHYIRFKAPKALPVSLLGGDCALYEQECRVVLNGMVRVVNVHKVLRAASYQGSGEVCFAVKDPVLEENDGIYTVTFRDGRCIQVQKTANATADATFSINAFSALITGNLGLSDCAWMKQEEADILRNEENLQKLFYRKPCWMADAF